MYKFKKFIGNPKIITWNAQECHNTNFSVFFFSKNIFNRFNGAGYNLDIMPQTSCLVFNIVIVG